jgi:hypothetical protein
MKDSKGHGSNGRGRRNVKPLPGHDFHRKTNDQLRYIIKDAGEAARSTRGMTSYNPNSGKREDTEGKYLDQVNDASTVLGYRDRTGAGPDNADAAAALGQGHPKSGGVGPHSSMVSSRDYDAFGRPRSAESQSEYDDYSRDMSLRIRNGGFGNGGRR